MSVIPASLKSSNAYCDIGLFAIGSNCFGPVCVNGRSLVPCPPCKIIPFNFYHFFNCYIKSFDFGFIKKLF